MLSLSIVICTKDRPEQLRRCLETIIGQSSPPEEIIIIDASRDDSAHRVANSFIESGSIPTFRYVHTRPSTAYQRNVGFKMANGDIVGSVDDDTELDLNILSIIREVFNNPKNTDVGGVMPRIINPNDDKRGMWSLSTLYKRIFLLSHSFARRVRIQPSGFPVFPFRRNDISDFQNAEVLNGLYFYRRKVAKTFRFYEGFRGYSFMEDAELSYRISQHYRLLYIPKARVLHLHVQVGRTDNYSLYRQIVENHHYFFTEAVRQDFVTRLAFYWSHFGLLISALMKKPKWGRQGSVSGFFAGLRSILKRQRHTLYRSAAEINKF